MRFALDSLEASYGLCPLSKAVVQKSKCSFHRKKKRNWKAARVSRTWSFHLRKHIPIPFLWMSLFSKLSGKGSQSSTEKAVYPWSQRKLTGASCLPRVAHAATQHNDRVVCLFGGVTKGAPKKDLYLIDPVNLSASATSTGGDAPSARCYHSIVSIGNQLIGKNCIIQRSPVTNYTEFNSRQF